jgi:hypothetical protein
MQHHPLGTEIYYAGDVANTPGFGTITRLTENHRFGAMYDIELEDGREIHGIPTMLVSDQYEGHHSPRFVLKAAYDAYWKARAQAPAWFHGIENMTLDADGYLRWKGRTIERLDPDFAQSKAFRGRARILEARCRHLEERGEPINKRTVVLTWRERVKQASGEGRGR